jgi:hypothetical protein
MLYHSDSDSIPDMVSNSEDSESDGGRKRPVYVGGGKRGRLGIDKDQKPSDKDMADKELKEEAKRQKLEAAKQKRKKTREDNEEGRLIFFQLRDAKIAKDGTVIRLKTNPVGKKVFGTGEKDKREDKFIVKRILAAIRSGHTGRDAAISAGITANLFNKWMREGEEAPEGTLAFEFRQQVELANVEATNEYLQSIRQASKKNWQASAWWLEKRRPETYGKKAELMLNQAKPFEVALADASFSDDEVKAALKAFLAANPEVLNPPEKIYSITEGVSDEVVEDGEIK